MPSGLFPALDILAAPPSGDLEELQGTILAALDDAGVTAVQELSDRWRLFFASAEERDAARATIDRVWSAELTTSPLDVADEDWARRSQEGLGPVRVGQVRILPPWAARETENQPSTTIDVIIQPSMGFGTGHHASTRLCVALLQELDLVGRRVLDVGTGSGVLAIVSARLGADAVLGIDDDPDALASARENLGLNAITSGIELRRLDFRALADLDFDVVTANLTGALLARGAAPLGRTLARRGFLIVSGLGLDEEASVRAAFEPALALVKRLEEAEWGALLYRRPE